MKALIRSLLYSVLLVEVAQSLNLDDLKNYKLYLNEICSYNGKPSIDITTDKVTCQCQKEYATFNQDNRTIHNQLIQCNYPLKSRFISLFFSLFIPIGIEYLYLMHYAYFVLYLMGMIIIATVMVTYFFASNSYFCFSKKKNQLNTFSNDKSDKRKEWKRSPQVNNESKEMKDSQYKSDDTTGFLVFKIFTILAVFLFIIGWGVNIGLIAAGVVRDGNGFQTFNDFPFIINIRGG